jgi:hypothetical protein
MYIIIHEFSPRACECFFILVLRRNLALVVATKAIKEGEKCILLYNIEDLVTEGHGKVVFPSSPDEILVSYTCFPLPSFFRDSDW